MLQRIKRVATMRGPEAAEDFPPGLAVKAKGMLGKTGKVTQVSHGLRLI